MGWNGHQALSLMKEGSSEGHAGVLSSDSVERGLIPTVVFPWSFSRVEWILRADVIPATRSLLS